jgi:hypothetical protein
MDCLSNSLSKNYPAEYMAAVLSNNMVTSRAGFFLYGGM